MPPLLILSLALIAACDPGRGVIFQVSPLPSPTADSARLAQSLEIARVFAEKYQMQTKPSDDECRFGRYFAQDSIRGRKIGLNFCVRPRGRVVEFRIVEIITSRWGPKGNALRSELLDTLRTRFGSTAVIER